MPPLSVALYDEDVHARHSTCPATANSIRRDHPASPIFFPSVGVAVEAILGNAPKISVQDQRYSLLRAALSFASLLLSSLLLLLPFSSKAAHAATCTVVPAHTPTEAETAFLHGDYDHAITLYQAQLQQKPDQPALIAALAAVYLHQQKITDADLLVQKAIAKTPDSAVLFTALGEVQYREGRPWLAAASADTAVKLDPCYAQAHLLSARLLRLSSMYASAAQQLTVAHQLDPHNPQIRRTWLNTLSLKERIAELESYLAAGGGDDPDAIKQLHFHLDYLKQRLAEPHKSCRLVSPEENAQINFSAILHDATHVSSFGLDVKLNDRNARLQIDTGAGGLVISRSVAAHAGLVPFSRNELGGVGTEGRKAAYIAYVDHIKIGTLEFQNCEVQVLDERNVINNDGLIGMNVFSHFLVTLDYRMRKLILGPLPKRPDDDSTAKPSLETANNNDDEAAASTSKPTTDASDASPAPAKPVRRGPFNRYIAPEMKDWTPVYRVGHNLMLPVMLNGSAPKLMIVDTGAFTTTVSPDVAREVTKVSSNDRMHVRGINGEVKNVYSADAITFRFANISQKVNDVVAFATPLISKSLDMDITGFIGYTALSQMTIGIDYRDGLMKFSYDPNRGYHDQR